jgi:hypothetical protein
MLTTTEVIVPAVTSYRQKILTKYLKILTKYLNRAEPKGVQEVRLNRASVL